MAGDYYIKINGEKIPVNEDVYKAHRQMTRYVRTLTEKDNRNGLLHYEELSTDEILGEESIYDSDQKNPEEQAIGNILIGKLKLALKDLSDNEREIIEAIYYQELSERQYAQKCGLPRTTIYSRKVAAIKKLKKFLQT